MSKASIERKFNVKFPKGFSREILDVISAGCELGYLTKEDVEFMMSEECNLIRAINRLHQRRKEQPDK